MIDPRAQIGVGVHVGERTRIWPFASVIRMAFVGDDCNIGSCSIVDASIVGSRCSIGHGAQVHPGSRLEDEVFVGPGAILCNDRWPRVDKTGFVESLFASGFVTIRVGKGASIGAGAVILPGVVIGSGAMIAAGSVVERNVGALQLHKRTGEVVAIDITRSC